MTMLIPDSRFDLVWFRLSCDHGWIRSGSVNVRKTTTTTTCCNLEVFFQIYDLQISFIEIATTHLTRTKINYVPYLFVFCFDVPEFLSLQLQPV